MQCVFFPLLLSFEKGHCLYLKPTNKPKDHSTFYTVYTQFEELVSAYCTVSCFSEVSGLGPNQDMWLPHSGQQVCMPRAFLLQHRITYLIKLSFPQWNKYIRWSGFQHSVNLLWSLNHPAWKCFSSENLFKGLEKESRKLHIFEKQYAVFI